MPLFRLVKLLHFFRYGIDRLVEDLIQESMAKGEFDNLTGKGKPLQQQNYNPYVDFVTHKINQVLVENGFTPEWITLQKEIAEEKAAILESISTDRSYYGPNPLESLEAKQWISKVKKHEKAVKQLNSKIVKFNLLVPILEKQMFLFNLEKEANKILMEGKSDNANKNNKECRKAIEEIKEQKTSVSSNQNLLSLLTSIFR
ncbi:hypothetical protein J437_LFUL013567 [Ladona fulva]|uniref:DnaJ homologue subfamily C member 28 conserved domain-containing protein n=1 Tax=Ladona fulva TaxID=123851 RepID=A0A8K0KHJ5_LADFU|nr:hypothetical protein J437_LFUL013567 [Ladona fulva]